MRSIEVLLIEDNPADVRLIREGLDRCGPKLGVNVRIAHDGEQALDMLFGQQAISHSLDGRYRPDMILLDLGLPKMDGETILHWIRAHGIDLSSAPVIVFSSCQHGIQDVLDSGANAYIVKPVGLMEYIKAIERFAVLWLKPLADAANN